MLVVTVEIWPGGRPMGKRHVGTMTLSNMSELADVSKYDIWIDGEKVGSVRHTRADGAWVLVRKALSRFVK